MKLRGKQIAMDAALRLKDLTRKERRDLNRIVRRQRKERKRAKECAGLQEAGAGGWMNF